MKIDQRQRRTDGDEFYSDFNLNFDMNPITGNLAKVVDEQSVKNSLINIILTMNGEWPHHRALGSRVYRSLFDMIDDVSANIIETSIKEAVLKETRAQLVSCVVRPDVDRNGYHVRIDFYTVRSSQIVTLTHFLRRVR